MYAEIHTASGFSFLEGASDPEDLPAEAARLGYEALALCDRDSVSGAPRFFQAARKAGVRALVGCEISLDQPHVKKGTPNAVLNRRLTVLVANRIGYRNLCRLLTRMNLRSPKGEGRARWETRIRSAASSLVRETCMSNCSATCSASKSATTATGSTSPANTDCLSSPQTACATPRCSDIEENSSHCSTISETRIRSAASLVRETCMSNCSATCSASKSATTATGSTSPANTDCLSSPQTACATPRCSANLSTMPSPACGSTAGSTMSAGC